MPTTLGDLVNQVILGLNQFTTNRERSGTFKEWVLDGSSNKIGIKLDDVSLAGDMRNMLVELHTTEIVHVSTYDSASKIATCPSWFRAQLGTVSNDTVTANSRVSINPTWPKAHVLRTIGEGIKAIAEDIFVAKEVTLTSDPVKSNYDLGVTDAESILKVVIREIGPSAQDVPLKEWTLDTLNSDGKKYLRVRPLGVAGRSIYVTYRATPVLPDPLALTTTWTSTGLPDSAQDLPVLYALMTLIPTADASKTQTSTVEQSERSRLVQAGSASASSRRYEQLFDRRLRDERRKLLDKFPPRFHKSFNG